MRMTIQFPNEFDISYTDLIKCLMESLGLNYRYLDDYTILEENSIHNKTNRKGIYIVDDVSYHGSPDYEFGFVTDDELKVKAFEIIRELRKILSEIYVRDINIK